MGYSSTPTEASLVGYHCYTAKVSHPKGTATADLRTADPVLAIDGGLRVPTSKSQRSSPSIRCPTHVHICQHLDLEKKLEVLLCKLRHGIRRVAHGAAAEREDMAASALTGQ